MGEYADQENLNCLAEMVPKLTKERDTLKEALRLRCEAEVVEGECYISPEHEPTKEECVDCDRHEKELAICLYIYSVEEAQIKSGSSAVKERSD